MNRYTDIKFSCSLQSSVPARWCGQLSAHRNNTKPPMAFVCFLLGLLAIRAWTRDDGRSRRSENLNLTTSIFYIWFLIALCKFNAYLISSFCSAALDLSTRLSYSDPHFLPKLYSLRLPVPSRNILFSVLLLQVLGPYERKNRLRFDYCRVSSLQINDWLLNVMHCLVDFIVGWGFCNFNWLFVRANCRRRFLKRASEKISRSYA